MEIDGLAMTEFSQYMPNHEAEPFRGFPGFGRVTGGMIRMASYTCVSFEILLLYQFHSRKRHHTPCASLSPEPIWSEA
jgi:hypothetical protein